MPGGVAVDGAARPLGLAGRLERWAARAWNVLNEGRGFLPAFTAATLIATLAVRGAAPGGLHRAAAAAGLLPALWALVRWDYPLGLRRGLWLALAAAAAGGALVPGLPPPPLGIWVAQLAAYAFFTVVVWGTLYYRWRIGTPLDNLWRFPRQVLATCDTTSGNAGEQVPKFLLCSWLAEALLAAPGPQAALAWGAAAGVALYVYGALVHRLGLHWLPPEPRRPAGTGEGQVVPRPPLCRRALVIVIDGCRADLVEQEAPFLRSWLEGALRYTAVDPVYPARTVTCFTSMLTGTYPRRHGVTSNLVLRRPRCDSLFEALERQGRRGVLLAVAHLHEVFPRHCRPFTAVMDNARVDAAILARARQVLEEEDPDLLVVQLIAVDQTGHSRGVLGAEQRERMRATDRALEEFWRWLEDRGWLADGAVVICADHGQSSGIGSHGHLAPGERPVPFGLRAPGVVPGRCDLPASIASLAPTLAALLGVEPPRDAEAPPLPGPWWPDRPRGDVWVVIPAHDEEATVGEVVARVPRDALRRLGLGCRVLVVDDGSRDATAARAREAGADLVLRHPRRRGLGAAVRAGFACAYRHGAAAAVLIDADGEYPPERIPDLLRPILAGAADYVLGSRFLAGRPRLHRGRYLGNRMFTALVSLLGGRALTDAQTGLRALSREALGDAEIAHDYNYAQVLTLNLLRKGYRVAEVPVEYRPRRAGRSFVRFPEYPLRVLPALWREWRRPLPPRGSRPLARVDWQAGGARLEAAAALDGGGGGAYNGGGMAM